MIENSISFSISSFIPNQNKETITKIFKKNKQLIKFLYHFFFSFFFIFFKISTMVWVDPNGYFFFSFFFFFFIIFSFNRFPCNWSNYFANKNESYCCWCGIDCRREDSDDCKQQNSIIAIMLGENNLEGSLNIRSFIYFHFLKFFLNSM